MRRRVIRRLLVLLGAIALWLSSSLAFAEAAAVGSAVEAPPNPPPIGTGFHLFNKRYALLGFNWQRPCDATSLELEGSFVPLVTHGLWWFGAYATAGFQVRRKGPENRPSLASPCFEAPRTDSPDTGRIVGPCLTDSQCSPAVRLGGGGEVGWRMIGFDFGGLRNTFLRYEKDGHLDGTPLGLRFRLGIALSDELFSTTSSQYSRACCPKNGDAVPCECERTPVGASVFLYYANELYISHGQVWDDGMAGISLKVGLGL